MLIAPGKVSARALERANGILTIVWLVLAVPAVLWWRNSVPFLVAVSVYANVAGHLAAWQGARAERVAGPEDSSDVGRHT